MQINDDLIKKAMCVETNLNVMTRQLMTYLTDTDKSQMGKIEQPSAESTEKIDRQSNFNQKASPKTSPKTQNYTNKSFASTVVDPAIIPLCVDSH